MANDVGRKDEKERVKLIVSPPPVGWHGCFCMVGMTLILLIGFVLFFSDLFYQIFRCPVFYSIKHNLKVSEEWSRGFSDILKNSYL